MPRLPIAVLALALAGCARHAADPAQEVATPPAEVVSEVTLPLIDDPTPTVPDTDPGPHVERTADVEQTTDVDPIEAVAETEETREAPATAPAPPTPTPTAPEETTLESLAAVTVAQPVPPRPSPVEATPDTTTDAALPPSATREDAPEAQETEQIGDTTATPAPTPARDPSPDPTGEAVAQGEIPDPSVTPTPVTNAPPPAKDAVTAHDAPQTDAPATPMDPTPESRPEAVALTPDAAAGLRPAGSCTLHATARRVAPAEHSLARIIGEWARAHGWHTITETAYDWPLRTGYVSQDETLAQAIRTLTEAFARVQPAPTATAYPRNCVIVIRDNAHRSG